VTKLPVSLGIPTKQADATARKFPFVRLVSVTLKPDHRDEYHSLYINKVIPGLQETAGCLHAYLIMPSPGKHESLSVTVWASRQDAEAYESSGTFASLIGQVKHTFTDMLQWKLELDPAQRHRSAGTEELKVEGYSVVTMKDFGS
jgi:quinol monooxygenase YgiN